MQCPEQQSALDVHQAKLKNSVQFDDQVKTYSSPQTAHPDSTLEVESRLENGGPRLGQKRDYGQAWITGS